MKHMILLILLVMGCASDNDSEVQDSQITGTWQLIEVISSWTNETNPASSLDYEEFYEFKGDSTVRKYRSTGEEALGTYAVRELSDGFYVEVIYNDPNTDLKESCGGNEFLRIENSLLKGGSLPCDGPGLNYKKVVRED